MAEYSPRTIVGMADVQWKIVSFVDDRGDGFTRVAMIYGEGAQRVVRLLSDTGVAKSVKPHEWLEKAILERIPCEIPNIPGDMSGLGDSR